MCMLFIMEPAKYSTYDIRVRAIKAVLMGQRKTDVAMAYQVDYSTLYRWCQRYSSTRNFSVLERKSGSGRPNILDIKNQRQLTDIVTKPASSFGYETDFWTCRRLIQITEKEIKNHAQRTWYCFSPLKGGGRLALREGKPELSHGIV